MTAQDYALCASQAWCAPQRILAPPKAKNEPTQGTQVATQVHNPETPMSLVPKDTGVDRPMAPHRAPDGDVEKQDATSIMIYDSWLDKGM